MNIFARDENGSPWKVVYWGKDPTTQFNNLLILSWCFQTYGNPDLNLNWQQNIKNGEIKFISEADISLFFLKWSNYEN